MCQVAELYKWRNKQSAGSFGKTWAVWIEYLGGAGERILRLVIETENIPRDREPLNQKFYRLANAQKSTGDPNYPPLVGRSKHIACSILGRAQASCLVSVGSLDERTPNSISDHVVDTHLGARTNSRAAGALDFASNMSRRATDAALISLVTEFKVWKNDWFIYKQYKKYRPTKNCAWAQLLF